MSFTSPEGGWEMPRDIRQYPACPEVPVYTEVKDRAFPIKTASLSLAKCMVQKKTTCVC